MEYFNTTTITSMAAGAVIGAYLVYSHMIEPQHTQTKEVDKSLLIVNNEKVETLQKALQAKESDYLAAEARVAKAEQRIQELESKIETDTQLTVEESIKKSDPQMEAKLESLSITNKSLVLQLSQEQDKLRLMMVEMQALKDESAASI
ncbi:hypothetical protein BCR41DRAFT_225352, partial [Lobosporangium transversale]